MGGCLAEEPVRHCRNVQILGVSEPFITWRSLILSQMCALEFSRFLMSDRLLESLQSISHAQDLLRRGLLQNAAITAISKEAIEEVAIDQDHDGQDAVRGHR